MSEGKFVEKVVFPAYWVMLVVMLSLSFYMTYVNYQHNAGLREVCQAMGGYFADRNTCLKADNLFNKE